MSDLDFLPVGMLGYLILMLTTIQWFHFSSPFTIHTLCQKWLPMLAANVDNLVLPKLKTKCGIEFGVARVEKNNKIIIYHFN